MLKGKSKINLINYDNHITFMEQALINLTQVMNVNAQQ
jgi:hypothetical protein